MSFHKDPIYYNISQINGYVVNGALPNQPAFVDENNSQIILQKSSDYYVSIARCTVPLNSVPRLIVPIKTGLSQTDPNQTIYTITFKYSTAPNVYNESYTVSAPVKFISQFINLPVKAPSDNFGNQDFSSSYYWVYDIEQILLMFNNSLQSTFATFEAGLPGSNYNSAFFPYITFDYNTRIFSINMTANTVVTNNVSDPPIVTDTTYFDQNTPSPTGTFPRLVLILDNVSFDLFGFSGYSNNNGANGVVSCFNKFNNVTVYETTETMTSPSYTIVTDQTVYKMTSSESTLSSWPAFSKIIISCNYGISTVQEYDSVPVPNQGSTNAQFINKPKLPMLTDLEVDKESFALNNNYLQFQSSNITQQRLISVTGDNIQSFNVSVFWLDVFGIRHPLTLPQGNPLTIKLAFYDKRSCLI